MAAPEEKRVMEPYEAGVTEAQFEQIRAEALDAVRSEPQAFLLWTANGTVRQTLREGGSMVSADGTLTLAGVLSAEMAASVLLLVENVCREEFERMVRERGLIPEGSDLGD